MRLARRGDQLLKSCWKRLLPLLGLWLATLAATQPATGETPRHSPNLPYTLDSDLAHSWSPTTHGHVADVNGDGVDELVCFSEEYGELNIFRVQDGAILQIHQVNLGGAGRDWERFSFHGCCDVDDDGAYELLVSSLCGDSFCLRAYGPGRGLVSETLLLCGLQGQGDQVWDGKLHTFTCYEHRPGELALVMSIAADFDLHPRQVVAYDCARREILWSYPGGAQIRQLIPHDVDGCGSEEIVFASSAPANGSAANTTDDAHSYVGLLSSDGRELWLRSLGGMFTDSQTALADVTGDGELEAVTLTSSEVDADVIESRLAVWRARDGSLIDETRVPGSVRFPHVLAAADGAPGSGRIFVVDGANVIRSYGLIGGRLRERGAVKSRARTKIDMVAAMPGMNTASIFTNSDGGHLAVYSTRLRELARFVPPAPAPPGQWTGFLGHFDDGSDTARLLAVSDKLYAFELMKAAVDPTRFIAVGTALAVGVLLAHRRTRRGLAAAAGRLLLGRPLPRAEDEERAALELLSVLEMGEHDRTLVLRPLRTLQKALPLLSEAPPAGGEISSLAERSLKNYVEFTRHAVSDVVAKSAAWGGAPGVRRAVEAAFEAVEECVAAVERDLTLNRLGADHVQALASVADWLEGSLRELREEVSLRHAVDVAAELGRAAEMCEAEAAGMSLEMDLRGLGDALGWLPPNEFQFIACNLISNAVVATEGRATRSLTVRADADGETISLRFTDTGRGIEEEDPERIFEYGHTSKKGGSGGGGLYFSRKVLAGRGGSIVVERSAPGGGTAFLVTLRRAPTRRTSGDA
jgi:signal transduction histidine kinase